MFCWYFLLLCKSFLVWGSYIYYLCFCFLCLKRHIKKCLWDRCQAVYCLCFLLEVLWLHVLYFSLYLSWVYFSICCKNVVQFDSFVCPVFPTWFTEEVVFSSLYIFASFVIDNFPYKCGFLSRLSILFHWSLCLFLC